MPIEVTEAEIPGVLVIEPKRFGDHRGVFCETFNARDYAAVGIDAEFVQDNVASSAEVHTLRGLHFQTGPMAQAKLLRAIRGSVLDVAVDIRKSSPTYGRSVAVELSAENWKQLYVPRGFAHGYLTLEPDTHMVYKVDGYYSREHEGGLTWNDPAFDIDWGLNGAEPVLNDRDRTWPAFAEFDSPFE